MAIIMYHNPRCTKSRQTLQLLKEHNIEPEVIEYLKTPPSRKTLSDILDMLGLEPRALIRKNETVYQEKNLGNPELSHSELIAAMVNDPILIERPIVINEGRGALGRPPEKIVEII